ncbi:MAG TPA: hypothetical protein VGP47_06940 [Parachlamydiaceae bacterium]|nr:hypothetical protein [Parachlamydiaceae bacterium]
MTLSISPFLPFELGESRDAQNAVFCYKKFNETKGEFSYLKNCFANLHNLQTLDPEIIITSAQASDALARVTFDTYEDDYQKSIIANYANHALVAAELDNQFWNDKTKFLLNKIMKIGFNPSQAIEAGIPINDVYLNNVLIVSVPNRV